MEDVLGVTLALKSCGGRRGGEGWREGLKKERLFLLSQNVPDGQE